MNLITPSTTSNKTEKHREISEELQNFFQTKSEALKNLSAAVG